MPAHGCRSLRAKDIYHSLYNLVLQQWGSMERTPGWSQAHRGGGEMEGTGLAGAETKRRDGK